MASELEEKLEGKLGEWADEEISKKISEFGGLLTRQAAVLLLCRQHGIETEKRLDLAHARHSALPFSFTAKVDRIFPVQEYRDGAGRSARLHISDASGSATLVLWNGQVALTQGEISTGDTLECTGAYARGGEIVVGRNGGIRKVGGAPATPLSHLSQGICNTSGEVGEIEPDYHYKDRKTGEERTHWSFLLCDGVCRRVVVWSAPPGTSRPSEGDHLRLENVSFKNGELHFNAYSRMVVLKQRAEKEGRLEKIAVSASEAVFTVGGKEFALPLADALAFLGIKSVPDGVGVETILSIKSGEAVGKRVKYAVEGGRLRRLAFEEEKK